MYRRFDTGTVEERPPGKEIQEEASMATVLTPNSAWARPASDAQIERTAAALEANGMRVIVVDTG